ncbi:hypothetical protein like AT5G20790 [Hibiscus trionum]|uniref:Uncharacterized protein n=1 Tax=Hibiscus trionum TaxID=183268 RepID=A0A9W7HPR9_HIBTR|nr:hypothetical protein like AT5G20790 [Hibiscus trionum]
MNQLLDSRLEALAFNYVSFEIFTAVNNIWTWIAVITTAVSFWSIRDAGVATASCSVKSHEQSQSTSVIPEVEEKSTVSPWVSAPASVTETSVSQLVCNDGVTKSGKSKLTIYYDEDIVGESSANDETTEMEWNNGDRYCTEGNFGGERCDSWERGLRLRKGETGWYRYQDLTVINGNVVRL